MTTPDLPEALTLVALDTVGSTNAEARRLAEQGVQTAPDMTLVWAREQTAGRGRRERAWTSPPGGLYTSLVLRPNVAADIASNLSFVAAVAVHAALSELAPASQKIQLKWPNDVLLNGCKVAGILLESASTPHQPPEWLILGMGLNVATDPEDTAYPATSLAKEGWPSTVEAALEAYCRAFVTWSGRWRDTGFGLIREAWLRNCRGRGEQIEVRLESETLSGVFEDVDADGALVLNENGRRRRVTAGDVFFANG